MSEYDDNAEKARQQLKNISPTMCYAKWAQVSLHLTNGKTHSCYHPPTHDIDVKQLEHDPSALHNTDIKKEERLAMILGERPEGCSYCWKIEDAGGTSDRIYRSGEYWAQNARKDIIASTQTGKMNPRYVEVNFNQACNFKCVYCSPHLSTTWEEEIKREGPYSIVAEGGAWATHNNIEYLERDGMMPIKVAQKDNPYVEAFWRWWPELYKTLEVFRMTGGEPLMDSNTYKVLDYIYENPNAWLELSLTSNLCPPKEELWDKFMTSVKKLEEIQIWESERFNPGSGNHWYVNMAIKNLALFVSLDSVGEQAEYIRHGLDYQKLYENADQFLRETHNTTLTFINTFNALSMPRFKEFLEMVYQFRCAFDRDVQGVKHIPIHDPNNTHPDYEIWPRQRVWFDIPLLRDPAWFSIAYLPEPYERFLEEGIEYMESKAIDPNNDDFVGFYDFEIAKAKRNLEWMQQERAKLSDDEITRRIDNLHVYTEQLDKRRGLSFEETFPEFKTL